MNISLELTRSGAWESTLRQADVVMASFGVHAPPRTPSSGAKRRIRRRTSNGRTSARAAPRRVLRPGRRRRLAALLGGRPARPGSGSEPCQAIAQQSSD